MDKCLPFFKTLKQAFAWTDECEAAFQDLKHYLSNPPLLSPSKEVENLYLYLTVSTTQWMQPWFEKKPRNNSPVYYVSQAFQGAESNYPRIEKIAFTLIVALRKLRQYFQANPILVMTDQPIKNPWTNLRQWGEWSSGQSSLASLISSTFPERPSKHRLWQISSPSSPF